MIEVTSLRMHKIGVESNRCLGVVKLSHVYRCLCIPSTAHQGTPHAVAARSRPRRNVFTPRTSSRCSSPAASRPNTWSYLSNSLPCLSSVSLSTRKFSSPVKSSNRQARFCTRTAAMSLVYVLNNKRKFGLFIQSLKLTNSSEIYLHFVHKDNAKIVNITTQVYLGQRLPKSYLSRVIYFFSWCSSARLIFSILKFTKNSKH